MKLLGTFIVTLSLALSTIGCGAGDAENGVSNEPQLPPEAVPDSDTVPVAPGAMSDNDENAPDSAATDTP